MKNIYLIRCVYHYRLEKNWDWVYLYWSNTHGWTDAIEDADLFLDTTGNLPIGNSFYTKVQWVELGLDSDSTS